MPVKIKVCGITRFEDAKLAASLGVDALGFIFCRKSPRYISPAQARTITAQLPPYIARVGVFVDEELGAIEVVRREAGIDTVQLHGNETPDFCARLGGTVVKAFSVGAGFDIARLAAYQVAGYLLDTWDEKSKGGTGRTFDWSVAREAALRYGNVALAGGLGPSNIEEALNAVKPWAVDLNSGVEVKPGVKNPMKVKEAVRIVREWKG